LQLLDDDDDDADKEEEEEEEEEEDDDDEIAHTRAEPPTKGETEIYTLAEESISCSIFWSYSPHMAAFFVAELCRG